MGDDGRRSLQVVPNSLLPLLESNRFAQVQLTMQSWMCSGTLKLVLDKPDSRNAGPDYQQIDVFPGLPVIFGKSQRCRVCLPELGQYVKPEV